MRATRRLIIAAGLAAPALARAQGAAFPTRPIRLVIPFTPAGTTDLVGRVTAEKLGQRLGAQVVVENRPGAGGNVAGDFVARSEADGHTLMLTTIGTSAINFGLYGTRMPYRPQDLVGVALMIQVPNVLMVANDTPARTLRELIALAAARRGGLNYGTAGIGTSPHICIELLNMMTGMQMQHVPYRGSGPMLTELVANRVDVGMDNIPSALPFIREGRIRGIGVTSKTRSAALPDLPTLDEAGASGFEATAWFGVVAPAATPRPVVNRLGELLNQVALEADFRRRMAELGADPPGLTPDGGTTPEAFDAFLRVEQAKWLDVVRRSGARIE
ncbi:Bug family tripartite tricarboxylate transporter substrate binding protein [Plastoroseomonas hellenica]|uniref:Bug family tripartite tricarboxylate transporter substrate binding protein n=1 Tax=Plastoroseomonas hellenica TaxID=2687306 RepID=UPI001BAE188C|nr:tripartite tricarboxylate transporter substrate binding protein [Plastoroseomonas hellenica]MBR0644353.1 tripartite tricarboxylate transporter substrate binding protein [Plastoroseomonas hellenica]